MFYKEKPWYRVWKNEQDLSKRSRETLKMKKVYTESSTGCVCVTVRKCVSVRKCMSMCVYL